MISLLVQLAHDVALQLEGIMPRKIRTGNFLHTRQKKILDGGRKYNGVFALARETFKTLKKR
jgi:hypothetical protein